MFALLSWEGNNSSNNDYSHDQEAYLQEVAGVSTIDRGVNDVSSDQHPLTLHKHDLAQDSGAKATTSHVIVIDQEHSSSTDTHQHDSHERGTTDFSASPLYYL